MTRNSTTDTTGRTVDLRQFYIARTLYVFTEQLIGISIPIIIYRDTNDAALAALSFFAIWAPRCLFPFVAARLIDATKPRVQMQAVDAVRIATLLVIAVLPIGAWLLIGAGLLSLLNLWAIALFEKGLNAVSPASGDAQNDSAVATFSAALRADRVALTISALISGTLIAFGSEVLLIVGAAFVLMAAHVLQARSNLLWGLSPVRAEPAGLRKIAFDVFANTTLRQLIYLLWALNLLQGIVFGALPVLMETTFQKDPAGAAALFAGIHIGSWVLLWAYPSVARRFSRPTRATWAMALSALGLAAAFLTSNVAVFATAVCLALSVRNILDVETIIVRNREIDSANFGQVMTVFLPLIYAPFAIAGLLVTWLFQLGGPSMLAPGIIAGALLSFMLWCFVLRQAFELQE
ncbi:MAG: hypothetical protein AAFX90_04980 [Pseudomonadota bacterium]